MVLRHLDSLAQAVPPTLDLFIKVLRLFKAVVASTFGYRATESYQEDIAAMKEAYKELQKEHSVSLTIKFHVIFEHVKQLVEMTGGKGLAEFSEQVTEASHHSFKKTWLKFLVKDIDSPRYLDRYLKAVLYHNFTHV